MADNATDAAFQAYYRTGNGIVPAVVHQLYSTEDKRVISIDYPIMPSDNAYNICISGNQIIPEFSMAMPVLAAGVAGLIIALYKSRGQL